MRRTSQMLSASNHAYAIATLTAGMMVNATVIGYTYAFQVCALLFLVPRPDGAAPQAATPPDGQRSHRQRGDRRRVARRVSGWGALHRSARDRADHERCGDGADS